MGGEWLTRRGRLFGCGMSAIALGDGLVGIPAIVTALTRIGFNGETTLEVAGRQNIQKSLERLNEWMASAKPSIAENVELEREL
jgi:inosose dehydratase